MVRENPLPPVGTEGNDGFAGEILLLEERVEEHGHIAAHQLGYPGKSVSYAVRSGAAAISGRMSPACSFSARLTSALCSLG